MLILDEPTIGLDPQQIIETRNLIRDLGKEHTIILSSHILPEVQAVCSRVLIINKGKIVASDTPENLSRGMSADNRLTVRVAGPETEALAVARGVPQRRQGGEHRQPGAGHGGPHGGSAQGPGRAAGRVHAPSPGPTCPSCMMKSMDLTLEEIFLNLITEEREVS